MMVLVIRDVALEEYKYIQRSGNIVCVFMCKVDIDSWPSYYFNGSYYIYILVISTVCIFCNNMERFIKLVFVTRQPNCKRIKVAK